ncbi:MAG: CotH kinase family protein, partial [Phycisphaerales bacterium]
MKRTAQKTAILIIPAVLVLSVQTLAYQEDLYDDNVLRTIQLEFSQSNWWSQLQANYQAKENILATMIVDGVTYEDVGVRFRGNTSYMMTGNSQKKPFNIEVDYTHENQRLMGYKTLNLINCMNDPTFMREVLYSNMCRQQIPSAKANFVRLEINGENWGIYANAQQLNAEFIEDWFPSNDGTRWRAEGMMGGWGQGGGGGQGDGGGQDPDDGPTPDPRPLPNPRQAESNIDDLPLAEAGGGGMGGGVTSGLAALTWQGSDSAAYEAVYELKNTNQDDPWASLINTCDVLNNTPLEQLPDKIEEVLDVDRALWLCAFEIIFLDDDGYVNKRGSDYCLYYEPETGRMHLMQYDGNECLGDHQWSLFYRENDPVVPIMYRLMDIPKYRQRYMAHARTILRSFFTEETLFPIIDAYQALIEDEVRLDNKKLHSNQAFTSGIERLKDTIENRRRLLFSNRALNRSAPEITAVSQEIVQNNNEQSLTITAQIGDSIAVSEVHLYVSEGVTERFIPRLMVDDGEHGDEA